MLLEFNDNNLDTLAVDKLTVVDFFSSWCGPCNRLAPIIEQLSNTNPDVVVGKLNVQENPMMANKYRVSAVPTIVFLKENKVVRKIVGFQTLQQLQSLVDLLK